MVSVICFFFQAEDGIRDGHVTGVQTCALPILRPPGLGQRRSYSPKVVRRISWPSVRSSHSSCRRRSEERRVGKECRARGGAGGRKKKKNDSSRTQRLAGQGSNGAQSR